MKKNAIQRTLEKAQRDGNETLLAYIDERGHAPKTLDEILAYYMDNECDTGANGRAFEVAFRAMMTKKIERVHPLGVSDMRVKGKAIEAKSGCGWLVNPEFYTPVAAAEYWTSTKRPIKKADYIAYLPRFDGSNEADALILTQTAFLKCLERSNLARVKKGSNGLYGIAIQSYIPSKKFHASRERLNQFLEDMWNNGWLPDVFAERHGLEVAI